MISRKPIAGVALLVLVLGVAGPFAQAQDGGQLKPLPRIIPYQGRLELNGNAFTGTKSVTFRLYLDATNCEDEGIPDWSQTQQVDFYAGRFSVQLGHPANPDPASFDRLMRAAEVFLSIEIEEAGVNSLLLDGCQVIRPAPYAHRSGGDVPIGTVIDWYRPPGSQLEVPIPVGYQICNGDEITDPRSPLNGYRTPDLSGQFVRGVVSEGSIGDSGGYDDLPVYNVENTDHVHQWSNFSDDGERDWKSYDSTGGGQFVMNWDNGLDGNGSGIYPLAAPNTNRLDLYTANPQGWTPTATPAGGAVGRNLPSYTGLLKLIRIY